MFLQHTGCLQEIRAFFSFIPFFIIQLIHFRVQEARLLRHQLPTSLPITNKQRRRGSDVERPTVKALAPSVSSGLLAGSCGLAHGEMYVFKSSHSTFSSQETPLVVTWRTRARHLGCHIPACCVLVSAKRTARQRVWPSLIGSAGFYSNHMQAAEEGFKWFNLLFLERIHD